MTIFTGLTSTTRKNIQLDAGALYKNFVPGTDTPQSATAKLIGATEGGSQISFASEIRQIPADGVKGPTKGYEVLESVTATLSTKIKEVTAESVKLALAAAAVSTTALTGYSKITMNDEIVDADYITNITWIGKISGSNNPAMIVLKNALCLNGFNFAVADKSEGVVPVTMTAHYDVSNLEDVPVEIYIPDVA